MGNRSRQKVAIIGAGLAGLSAAYELRDKANVTIFEREDRLGGRVLTSKEPSGEHGAESLLESECELRDLLAELGIAIMPCHTEPRYFFRGLYATGAPDKAGEKLLPLESANRIAKLFELVRLEHWPKTTKKFGQWLSLFLEGDKEAMQFVRMLLAGETCAPLHHLSARYSRSLFHPSPTMSGIALRGDRQHLQGSCSGSQKRACELQRTLVESSQSAEA
jgi:protoporphyrinogen oxidase